MNKRFPGARVIRHGSGRETHRAGKIVIDPWHMIENGYLIVENGIITEVSRGNPGSKAYDHGPGVLMPGLVNAHLHLELTALKDKLPFDLGFKEWVKELLKARDAAGADLLIKEAQKGLDHLIESGSLFAAEISTLGITKKIVKESNLFGIWFHEFLGSIDQIRDYLGDHKGIHSGNQLGDQLGNHTDTLCKTNQLTGGIIRPGTDCLKDQTTNLYKDLNGNINFSVAGHAPHTSSPKMLQKLKQESKSRGLVFSIHVAESDDESEFITSAKGEWALFLKERNIDFSSWPVPARSEVEYLDKLGLLDVQTIAVHLLNCDSSDLDIIAKRGAKPVLSPRSNINLHGKLPDLPKMLKMGLKPGLGTDSLASSGSLSVFDEMAFVAKKFPGVDPGIVFAMATINGAEAIGMEKIAGTLEPGKTGDFLYLPLETYNLEDFLKRVASYE